MAGLRLVINRARGQPSRLPYPADPPGERNKIKVLIVDDDFGICQTLSDILKAEGYQVDIANDGLQAIAKIKKNEFDVVLLDIIMPGMNGVETYKEMKKVHLQAKVIMFTAYSAEELVSKAYREGVTEVMYKPLKVDSVINSIMTLCSQ